MGLIKEGTQTTNFEINGLNIKVSIVDITPEIANSILKYNQNNRNITPSNLNFLSREIINNNWQFDGQPIRIDYNGNLLDGQHRLNSIIKTNTTLKMLVITGLRPETFKVMDTGKIRNGSDVLSIDNVQNPSLISSSLKLIHSIKAGVISGNKRISLSNTDLIDYYKSNKGITTSVNYVITNNKNFKSVITTPILITLHYLFSEVSELDANEFIGKLCTGTGLSESSAILVLRDKLIKNKSTVNKKYKLTKKDIIGYTMVAWNKFRVGEEVKSLRLEKDFKFILK